MENIAEDSDQLSYNVESKHSTKKDNNITNVDTESKVNKTLPKDDRRFSKRMSKVGTMGPRGSIMQRSDRKHSVSQRTAMRRNSCRENTTATGRPKVGYIDFERLKAEVYRDWVGRRDAFDLGKITPKKDAVKTKQKPSSEINAEGEAIEDKEIEKCQAKGVKRDTGGLEASLLRVEEVKRRSDVITPLSRKSSATTAKPLRTPSNTALRVGSRNDIDTPKEEPSHLQEVGADDLRKLDAISRRAKRKAKGIKAVATRKKSAPSPKANSNHSHGLTDLQVKGELSYFHSLYSIFHLVSMHQYSIFLWRTWEWLNYTYYMKM